MPFVEGPELLCFQFQSAGYVQAVERVDAEARGVPASQVRANVENSFRQLYFYPQAGSPIFFEMTIQFLRPCGGNLAMEDVLCDGMGTLRVMKGSKPN